jgi:hypothetical protein
MWFLQKEVDLLQSREAREEAFMKTFMQRHACAILIGLLMAGCAAEIEPSAVGEAQERLTEMDTLGRRLGPISANIVQRNREAEQAFHLLTRLELQPNEILEFYEPMPGDIVRSVAGAPNAPTAYTDELRKLSERQIWDRVSNGARAPQALEEAIVRKELRERESVGGAARVASRERATSSLRQAHPNIARGPVAAVPQSPVSGPLPGTPGQDPQTLTQTLWCDSEYYWQGYGNACNGSGPAYFKTCVDNHWNGAWAQRNDVYWIVTNVCAATGPVYFTLYSPTKPGGAWDVPTDTVRNYERHHDDCVNYWWIDCPNYRADVLEASGDRFHFRFYGFYVY